MTSEPEKTRSITLRDGGAAEVPEKHILRFPDGLFGFPGMENYAIAPYAEDSPFLWLQSIDEPRLAFLVIDPRFFAPDYVPVIAADELNTVSLKSVEEGIVLTIVVIPEDPKLMTANLMGPLIINPKLRIGRQAISQSPQHLIRHRILGEEAGNKG